MGTQSGPQGRTLRPNPGGPIAATRAKGSGLSFFSEDSHNGHPGRGFDPKSPDSDSMDSGSAGFGFRGFLGGRIRIPCIPEPQQLYFMDSLSAPQARDFELERRFPESRLCVKRIRVQSGSYLTRRRRRRKIWAVRLFSKESPPQLQNE